MRPSQKILLPVRVDMQVATMKEYSTLSKSPEMEPHHQNKSSTLFIKHSRPHQKDLF